MKTNTSRDSSQDSGHSSALQKDSAPRSSTVPAAGGAYGHLAQLAADLNQSAVVQSQVQMADSLHGSAQLKAQRSLAAEMNGSAQSEGAVAQRAAAPGPNRTGLPDNLKSGVENLSGLSLDDVNVHYNSAKPAQLNALAYAQGSDIHVAPGQEKHLPHEAWHIVQQKQGRVKPTMQMKTGTPINDDRGLEKEADVMGQKALQTVADGNPARERRSPGRGSVQKQADLDLAEPRERLARSPVLPGDSSKDEID